MRIAMDARFTRTDYHDGISRYGASLIEATAKYADVIMLINDERQLRLLPDLPWAKINSPISPSEVFVAQKINVLHPDVVFTPLQTMGSWGRKYALLLTVQDLIYYQHPQPPGFLPAPVRALWRIYHKAYWPQRLLLNRADLVTVISKTTRALVQKFRITTKPMRIVYNAPQAGKTPRDLNVAPEKSLVYMSSFMPYKNVETLIAGMKYLPEFTLHLLSRITPEREKELRENAPTGANIVFHNGVSDTEYDDLVRHATALVNLSKAEGFGLPLVEAMALGTPVVAADTDIYREVGGDAALYVDADSAEAYADAVRSLTDLERWREQAQASLERAESFSWDDSAKALVQAAETAVELFKSRSAQRRS